MAAHKGQPDALTGKGAGLFYGVQTLLQLLPTDSNATAKLPCMIIEDAPRFGYRGLMLDVSRHFFTVQQIKDLLDLMAVSVFLLLYRRRDSAVLSCEART